MSDTPPSWLRVQGPTCPDCGAEVPDGSQRCDGARPSWYHLEEGRGYLGVTAANAEAAAARISEVWGVDATPATLSEPHDPHVYHLPARDERDEAHDRVEQEMWNREESSPYEPGTTQLKSRTT